MRAKSIILAVLVALSLSGPGAAQTPGSSPAASPAAPAAAAKPTKEPVVETEAERAKKRRDTIRYGIDAEISELLKTLASEKEGSFNPELLDLFLASRSPKLRVGVLELFRALEWAGAETPAFGIVENRDLEEPGLVAASLAYLAAVKSKRALALAPKIIEEDDKKLLPALIQLLGRAGGPEEEKLLLEWLKGDAPSEALRQSAIRALGDIGSSEAVERLAEIAASGEQGMINRMYAVEALGKIGDLRGLASVIKAANAEDPNVRAAAVEALSTFKTAEAEAALLEAFRDSFVKSRLAACKAAGKRRLEAAVPILSYKAAKDPEKAVKAEALRALAEIGGSEAFSFLRKTFEDPKSETASRVISFGLLARKDPSSISALAERLALEAKEKERSFYTALAREVAQAADATRAAPLARVLLADKDYLIRLGGLEWAKKTKAPDIRADLAAIAEKDPSEAMRKRAAEILAAF